ncbi:MAG: Ig-like domain-containing protein, partial [Pedosphaera parvula]|nr:Ig-like domain-containing protein [Pedosphaera parvula]
HEHSFNWASTTLAVNTNDILFTYVYLDPGNPPAELMLSWNGDNWEHRAYWGANNITYGADGTASRWYMGPLPAPGQWVRLEVPAANVGLEGQTLTGMSFSVFDGRATWDYTGKSAVIASAPATPTVTVTATDAVATIGTADNALLTFTRDGDTSAALVVNYTLGGTAVKWNDYRTPAGDMPAAVTIPAGAASTTLTVVAVTNSTGANPLTAVFALSPDAAYLVGTPNSATLNLLGGTPADTTAPSIGMTSPGSNATVSGKTVTVSAIASDNVGVAGVQFKFDGANLGTEITNSPYSLLWDTTAASNGSHTLTAVARDASGNQGTAAPTIVLVSNSVAAASVVWIEDALPSGAVGSGSGGEAWTWTNSSPAPFSGALAHQSARAAGLHEHSFNWASTPLAVNTNDVLFTYVYLDLANPPTELMLSWNANNWEHR